MRPRGVPRPVEGRDFAQNGLEDLLEHVARGDRAAFERVYDLIAGPVYGLVLRVLRDPAQSEEVAQEALVEVWRNAAATNASAARPRPGS